MVCLIHDGYRNDEAICFFKEGRLGLSETRYSGEVVMLTDCLHTGQTAELVLELYSYNGHWLRGDPKALFSECKLMLGGVDMIVVQPGDVRGWDRYAYVRNNPTDRIDPTGHMDDGWEGGCNDVNSCKHEYLRGTAIVLLTRLGGRNDLEAMAQIVDYAAYLYGNYQQMMPMLSGIFLGLEQSNSITVFNAAFRDYNACNLAIGREQNDCKTEDGRSFRDLGFHPDFRDNHNQLFHFWAYVSTTAATETRWDFVYSPLIPPGVTVSLLANN